MSIPDFRTAVRTALFCAAGCFLSPFDWGAFTSPFPTGNLILSMVFHLMVCSAGVRTIQEWWWLPPGGRWPSLILASFLLVVEATIGFASVFMQTSSAHNQLPANLIIVGFGLGFLAIFAILHRAAGRKDLPELD